MKRLAIFASGTGTNTKNIIRYFHHHPEIRIECVICNNPKAKVLDVAADANIASYLVSKKDLDETDRVPDLLKRHRVDFIVLAGFLLMIPQKILSAYPNKIINIHPALLPKYGGAGMYGMRVHQAVIAAKEKETGVTIHYLNEKYDDGEIIFQKAIPVEDTDSAETIAQKVHQLEHEWYPKVIEDLLSKSQ